MPSRCCCWRRDPESNRARRICNPLHNRFAIAPFTQALKLSNLLIHRPQKRKGSRGFPFKFGAGNEIRTRDLNLGKVALYQLSYSRVAPDVTRMSEAQNYSAEPPALFCSGWILFSASRRQAKRRFCRPTQPPLGPPPPLRLTARVGAPTPPPTPCRSTSPARSPSLASRCRECQPSL